MIRRAVIAAAVGFAVMLAVPAQASTFTLSSFTVGVNTTDPGLVLFDGDFLKTPTSFNLNNVGDSFTASLFRVGTNETALNLDDLIPHAVSVNFAFSQPLPAFGGVADGISGAFWLGAGLGYVVWDNPLSLAFGTNGLLAISLTNAVFTLPGSSLVSATFTLLKPDVGTPEPASLLLVGAGLAALGARRHRRRAA
jgi:hypothetical protein